MITLELCYLQLSQALKEAGFDAPVQSYFHDNIEGALCEEFDETDDPENYNSEDWANSYISRPSLALAAAWLRGKGLHVYVANRFMPCGVWCYEVADISNPKSMQHLYGSTESYPIHDDALSAGIAAGLLIYKDMQK